MVAGRRGRALISWSTGKDAAYALHAVRQAGEFEVAGLFTTITGTFSRASMHGTRLELIERQAQAAGLPLRIVDIPWPCPNEVYEAAMGRFVDDAVADGITHIVFGDLFLEDVRSYREARLEGTGLTPVFPLWGRPTAGLARDMIAEGIDARVVCLDPSRVDRSLAGARFDAALLDALPDGVDPCAENGEFHTCVVGGPMFDRPVEVEAGEVVERDGFVFADLVPVSSR